MGIKMNNNSNLFMAIQKQVEAAEKAGQPIKTLIRQQIDLLQASHDEFIKVAQAKGYDLKNPQVGEIEVGQYASMKALAKKAGLPVEKYDELIKDVRIRIFGEENYKIYFGDEAK